MTGATSRDGALRVTVSIVSHGHDADVARLLASLDRHLVPDGAEVRIVLTENLPPREGAAPASRFDLHRIVNPRPKGFGANHNQAFRAMACDWFLVLNPDIWLDGPLDLGGLAALSGQDVVLSATILDPDGAVADFERPFVTPVALARRLAGWPRTADGPTWFAAIFLAIPAPVYAALGGFDEGYHMYVEDCDLGWRARALDVPLRVQTGWQVRHHAYRASRRSLRHLLWHVASLARFWRKCLSAALRTAAPRPNAGAK